MEKDILHQGPWKRADLSGGRSKIKIKKSVTYLYLLYTNKLSTASCRNCVEICILRPPEDALGNSTDWQSWQQTRSPQTRGSWQQTSSPQATGLLPALPSTQYKIQCKVPLYWDNFINLYFTPPSLKSRPLPMSLAEDAFFRVGYTQMTVMYTMG